MDTKSVKLVELTLGMKSPFLEFADELKTNGDDLNQWLFDYSSRDFEGYVRKLDDWKHGRNLPIGWVPSTTLWLVAVDGTILGRSSLRHRLTEFLRNIGGHIGYIISPSQRRRGYGTEILRLTLDQARQMRMQQVLVTCDEDNIGSAKIIENNGGVFKNTYWRPPLRIAKKRYWITIQ